MSNTDPNLIDDRDRDAIYQALNRVQALIEFNLDGTIVSANQNFLDLMEYSQEEIVGAHHRIFCEPSYASSEDYADFWRRLNAGEYIEAAFSRLTKSGKTVWLRASYNPVLDDDGKPIRIVKFATDVTESKLQTAEFEAKMQAIDRVQAVIEFDLVGNILLANENFLRIFGYDADELVGQHHRIFCEKSYADSGSYAEFWRRLGEGNFDSGEFKRLAKDGREVWLQASYNPIFDGSGKPIKVVKFASDITREVEKRSLAMLEMATPVTKIWEGVLFAPIVGIIDSKRAMDIMEKVLGSIADNHARIVVIDISGVGIVDTAVANHLIKVTKAAVLMGCDAIISGISPAIAQTITELGIELGSVRTTSTIEAALKTAISVSDS